MPSFGPQKRMTESTIWMTCARSCTDAEAEAPTSSDRPCSAVANHHTTHGPNPQLLKGLVVQSTRIVLPHVVNESLTNNDVNEYVDQSMN